MNRGKGSGGGLFSSRLRRSHGPLQLALLLASATPRLSSLLAELLPQLFDLRLRHVRLLLVRVLPIFGSVMFTKQEVERGNSQFRVRAEESGGDHVDRLLIAPDVATVELNHGPQCVLSADWRRGVLQNANHMILKGAVEGLVAVLLVGRLDVGHDMRVQPRAQSLRERRQEPAIAEEDECLEDGSTHRRLEHVMPLLEQPAQPLRHLGHHGGEAGGHVRDEAEEREEVRGARGWLLV
eukprot:scaffold179027_cov30-Tisochrysis_lutea.AAC.3